MDKILLKQTHIIVENYTLGENKALEEMLTCRDKYDKVTSIYYSYDTKNKVLRLPRGIDVNFLSTELDRPLEFVTLEEKPKKMTIKLKVQPRNELQTKSIMFLTGEGEFSYTNKYSQLSLNLPTGEGKTYVTIASCTRIKEKVLIITNVENIKEQWYQSLLKFTNINEEEIININSSKILKKIWEDDLPPYKIYLVNHATLTSFANKYSWFELDTIFKNMGIGVKVIDEAHKNFGNTVMMDLYTNVKKTIYLTATLNRSDWREDKVFNTFFSTIAKYGKNAIYTKEKTTIYVPVKYNSHPSVRTQARMKTFRGFNRYRYCDYCIENEKFIEVLTQMLTTFTAKDYGKILILISKIDSGFILADMIREKFPNKKVGIYNSKIDKEEKIEQKKSDIIISTAASLGTGSDINNLRVVIMCEAYSSDVISIQTLGRLRTIEGVECFFVELVDEGFNMIIEMQKRRERLFKYRCSKILKLRIK